MSKPVQPQGKESRPYIGGQAVLEGVMMRSPDRLAIAVRRAKDKKIQVSVKPLDPPAKKGSFLGWPIVRGVVAFIAALKNGMDTINESARMLGDEEEEQPSAFERWLADKLGKKVEDVVVAIAMLVAIVLAVGLFFVLPSLAGSWFKSVIDNRVLANLLEGVVRLAIFLAYILSIAKMKEIRRVFCYHGAEHKTVHCYEHAEELTVENCRKYSIMHPRCGTAFLLIVMIFSILFFTVFGWDATWYTRLLSRLLLLPLVMGLSFEILQALGRHENAFVRVLRWPGMQLQRLTAKEPDDSMLEVAIQAMKAAAGMPYEAEDWQEEQAELPKEAPQPENEAPAQAPEERPQDEGPAVGA